MHKGQDQVNMVEVYSMLINVKMPTIVGILTLISRINFMLSLVEHGIFL